MFPGGARKPISSDSVSASAPPSPTRSELSPVFVGGAPRSGTTAVARLIGAHPRYEMVPREARFHSRSGERGVPGLIGVLQDEASVEEFIDALQTYWWNRSVMRGGKPSPRGLHQFLSREQLERALGAFEEGFRRDRYAASGRLLEELFGTVLDGSGASGWIEMTPTNASVGSTLHRCIPSMRLVHVMRDGRDVACSTVNRYWGPRTAVEAIDWWAERVRRGHRGCESLPSESVFLIKLEDLVLRDRETIYGHLVDFLAIEDHPAMRHFFDTEITPANAHVGRWQTEVQGAEREAFERRYREVLHELAAEGIWWDSDS